MQIKSNTNLLNMYKCILYIRLVEETIASQYKDNEMRCPVHLSIGQEATAVGVCSALENSDKIFSTHRCHAHYLAKGGCLEKMISEIYGKETGCCGGRGGSMHLNDDENGIIASIPIVGSNIPLAVGSALSDKINNSNTISVAFTGDGSLEEGVFHESVNFAQLNKLSVLFVCENNLYSVYTPLDSRQPKRPIMDIGKSHHIHTLTADGNDVEAVFNLSIQAVEFIKSGKGPVLLVLNTYRWREHCGPNYDNHLGYRTEEEFEKWRKHDPLEIIQSKLISENLLNDKIILDLKETLVEKIALAFEFAKNSNFPDSINRSKHIYSQNNNNE